MSNKKYWTSLEELNETPQYKEQAAKEFNFEIGANDAEETGGTNRRDFLKAMGFSVSVAALASACKIPTNKAIPYTLDTRKAVPEVVPGVADYFASTYTDGNDFVSILVKTREGRPIKIEGNNDSPITSGGTNARTQATVLNLYDVTRLAAPTYNNSKANWKAVDAEITQKLNSIVQSGGKVALVTGSVVSTITKKAIDKFVAAYPGTTVVSYDAISSYATRKANQISIGSAIIPTVNYDKADVIVGFNADFLGTGISSVENTKKYIANRVPTKENPKMSRHHQFQSTMTITGASADYRYPVKPSEEKQALMNLLAAVGGGVSSKALSGKDANDGIAKVAKELLAAKGKSVVISGTNDVDIQLLVNAINATLGNYGSVIDTANTYNLKSGNDEALAALANDLKSGVYKGIILLDTNPVYNTPYAEIFKNAIQKAELSVSTADRPDESAQYCKYVCPNSHYLESWDIISPKTGFYGFVQPAIRNLFDTRQAAESLMTWAGDATPIAQIAENEIAALTGGNYQTAVQAGFYGTVSAGSGAGANAAAAIAAVKQDAVSPKGMEVLFYEKVGIGDGLYANNPFLQEMPDPVAKVTWDNYVCIPYSYAKEKGIDAMPSDKNVPIAKVTINGKSLELPVVVQFGQAANTLAIALGYGRVRAGRAGDAVGKDVYPFLKAVNGATGYSIDGATIELTGKNYELGINQTYHSLMEDNNLPNRPMRYRGEIVKETTLAAYKENDHSGNEDREHIKKHFSNSLYDGYKPNDYKQGHHWGMVVDLNACIGCGSCVVSCSIENNVPVVGRRQVYRSQEMHWMRIDRYYNGNPDNPDVSFQPMMCQHCNNAPCENVCPVNATNHSSEGLNQMAYNRCIGTRYCANNCPYKVRRFNWLDYQGSDSFGKFNDGKRSFTDTEAQSYMFEDLTRMVLNPDVVTRTRGVIEKCSFCVQRIQEGKLNAKNEGRPLKDGDIKTACQTACPTNAITFGDQNNKESVVAKTFDTNGRNYFVLEEQHFLPAVGYQVKIRNKDEKPADFFIHQPGVPK
ncbi:MAG: TAT-variant-translocated molybdopterin oxidoreductase [Sphingobacteriales bacterium]|nr:TAT-variant-translocated molybdopterin oxidoreductase [Sphingobacteriales bacterium]